MIDSKFVSLKSNIYFVGASGNRVHMLKKALRTEIHSTKAKGKFLCEGIEGRWSCAAKCFFFLFERIVLRIVKNSSQGIHVYGRQML